MSNLWKTLAILAVLCGSAGAVDYQIVCVRSVRPDDTTFIRFPEVVQATAHPPSDLVVRRPDGTVEVLVSGNGTDALFDPKMSFDGKSLYYVRIPDCKNVNTQRGLPGGAPRNGADIYRYDFATQKSIRITDQAWRLPAGLGNWSEHPSALDADWHSNGKLYVGYGVINLGPCPLPGGKLAFTSNRRGYQPPRGLAFPNSQLFVLDDDGTQGEGEANRNVECVGHLNVSSALHPTLISTGEIIWSSHESQGLRDGRLWSLWRSYPDGRQWGPVYSALTNQHAFHFHGQRSDGGLFSAYYYNLNNNGFGTLLESPLSVASPEYLGVKPVERIPSGFVVSVPNAPWYMELGTQRRGTFSVTPWTTERDHASGKMLADRTFQPLPKVTHPAPAPRNAILVTITPGPANNLKSPTNLPVYQCQIGLIQDKVAQTPGDVEILLSDEAFNYTQPIAMAAWTDIYGSEPPEIEFNPNPTATPFGIVGSSSAHIGQWKSDLPHTQGFSTGIDVDETGADKTKVPAGIDIVALEPTPVGVYGRPNKNDGWSNAINERVRLLARVMFDEAERPVGDTSWWCKIPADTPFTFRTFDARGRTVTFAQTWHQVRPGETRVNCGGCHNHSGQEVKWHASFAKNMPAKDFRDTELRTPEFNRDVLPIFQAKCWGCHGPDSNLLKLDATIAKSAYVSPGMSFKSRLSKAVHGEGTTARMPLDGEPLSDEELRKIDEWIDFFCLVSVPDQGAWSDSLPPTVFVSRSGELKVGAYDYLSKLAGPPVATVNGESVTLIEDGDSVWTAGQSLQASDVVAVTVSDNAGNESRVERFIREDAPDVPDEMELLKKRVAELEAALQAWRDWIQAAPQ